MSRRVVAVLLAAALPVAAAASTQHSASSPTVTVTRVVDGDTLDVSTGARVRLVQVDAPELGSGECYSRKSAKVLRALVPVGSAVRLEADARLDRFDRYGRLLRYVHRRSVNVNVELVRRGAATVWFYDRARGRYAGRLLAEGRAARAARRGLWGACKTVWDPYGPATTHGPRTTAGTACDASYPDACIAPPPPDLDCRDVPGRRFRVSGDDRHRFDGDRDGIGCERD